MGLCNTLEIIDSNAALSDKLWYASLRGNSSSTTAAATEVAEDEELVDLRFFERTVWLGTIAA
jgi:hypothetical protein